MAKEIKIIRDIGAGCVEAAMAAITKMNDLNPPFIPGMQMGKKVKVLYTIPVTFRLE